MNLQTWTRWLPFVLAASITHCGSGDSTGDGTAGTSSSGGSSGGSSGAGASGSGGAGSSSGSSGGVGSGSTGSSASSSGASSTSSSGSGGASGSGSGGGSSGGDDGGGVSDATGPDAPSGPFTLTGSDFVMASGAAPPMGSNLCFKSGQTHMTGDISPPLAWSGAPPGTSSYAVSLHDTENGGTHWVMWNIPVGVTSLAAMLPSGAMPGAPAPSGSMQAAASWVGAPKYAGPGAGAPVRAYKFTVWAMNTANLTIPSGHTTATMYSQDLPMNSIASATLMVCGDQTADCSACTDSGK